ncbi:MAG: hypothetical protein M1816_000494 [Peltula sp. TS41687]|nr:MAG: hypothetical protein M1816_000494 [Peltula sp. TS41687]
MLAARDQENLVHGRQVAASSKPLNQGLTNMPPKTPGAKPFKTPYKAPLNDENAITGKTMVKGNHENLRTVGKAGGGFDKNAFVTPLGPRNRAPLGFKTTNAKTKPFQTPAVPPTVVRDGTTARTRSQSQDRHVATTTTTTARKPKPKISHAETAKVDFPGGVEGLLKEEEEEDEDGEEREIEYMPPKSTDLPDHPDDFPPDMEYRQFQGRNLTRGWFDTYCNPVGEDGLTRFERQLEESHKKADEESRESIKKLLDDMPLLGINVPEYPGDETIEGAAQRRREAEKQQQLHQEQQQQKQQQKKTKALPVTAAAKLNPTTAVKRHPPPSTLTSKQAASLLSTRPQPASASASRPAAAVSKPKPTSLLNRVNPKAKPATKPTSTIHPTAAKASSTTTLGYTKGRRVSHELSKARLFSSSASSSSSSHHHHHHQKPNPSQPQRQPPPRSGSSSSLMSMNMQKTRGLLGLDGNTAAQQQQQQQQKAGNEEDREEEILADRKSMAALGLGLGPGGVGAAVGQCGDQEAEEEFVLTLG